MQKAGEKALAGLQETFDGTHIFNADAVDRTIFFKGIYIAIYRYQVGTALTRVERDATAEFFTPYFVPATYSVYVRQATVYWEIPLRGM